MENKKQKDYQHPPHNMEIEASLLGIILRNNQLLERIDNIHPEHF